MPTFFRDIIIAALLLLFTSGLALAGTAENLSASEAYRMLQQKKEEMFLLDVRTVEEYRQARLAGSRLIPINHLIKRLQEVPKNRPILVYCAVGSRSAQVVGYLARLGYPEIYNLYGGIYAWKKEGYPVLKGLP